MTLHRPAKLKALAIDIALAITLIGSLALVVWQRGTADRIDDLIRWAIQAQSAGDIAAFEGYRESANLLVQLEQTQWPWIYAGYPAIGIVLIVVWSRLAASRRTS